MSVLSCLSCLSVCLSLTLVYCGQTVGWIKMKLGTEVDLGPGHIVLDGDPAPPKGHSYPICGPRLLCLPLLISLAPRSPEVLLWHRLTRVVPEKRAVKRLCGVVVVCCRQTAGLIKMPPGMEVDLGPGDIVLDGDPAPHKKGHSTPPHFSVHIYCGQTVAHLMYC